MNESLYYFDWTETGRRNRYVSNHRILVYGDISTHEVRYAVMKACNCRTDAISTNIPLCEHLEHVCRQIQETGCSIVVIGENANKQPANCECLEYLRLRNPHTRFVLATSPWLWMQSPRYRGDESVKKINNERCREIARATNTPCIDVEQCMLQHNLVSVQSAQGIKYKLALSYLAQFRISKAWKCLKQTDREIMHLSDTFLAQQVGKQLKRIARLKASIADTLWRNTWHRSQAVGIVIGDSNTRRLSRANSYLSDDVDMYTTSYPMLSLTNEADIRKAIRPQITHVCFSLGAHHLDAQSGEEFGTRIRSVFDLLRENGRQVLVLTSTPWVMKNNYKIQDERNNELIRSLNGQIKEAAGEYGFEVLDLHDMLKDYPHDDYVHFIQSSYNKPARMMERWIKGERLRDIFTDIDEECSWPLP